MKWHGRPAREITRKMRLPQTLARCIKGSPDLVFVKANKEGNHSLIELVIQ